MRFGPAPATTAWRRRRARLAALALGLGAAALPAVAAAEPAPPPPLVIVHAVVVDVARGALVPGATVVVAGGRIAAVVPERNGPLPWGTVPAGARRLDARGLFLLPGLWDMHVHLTAPARELPLYLANGVLGVRDMGGVLDDLRRWREEVASGAVAGPRIVLCGPVLDGPNPAHPGHAVVVADEAGAARAVADLKSRGADFIKVYDRLPRAAYFAVAREARRAGLPFVGHVPNAVTAAEASGAGQRSIEHLTGILEGCSTAEAEILRERAERDAGPPSDPSGIPTRLAASIRRLLETYDDAKAAALFALLARNGTWQDPTLTAKRSIAFVDDLAAAGDPRLRYVPKAIAAGWDPRVDLLARYRAPDFIALRKRLYAREVDLVRALYRSGVPLLAGTDTGGVGWTFPGFSLHDELALLAGAGLRPADVLRAATLDAARFLGLQGVLGTVEKGKIADLVLVHGDPLSDVRNAGRVEAVVTGGRLLMRVDLDALLAGVEREVR